MRMPKWARQSKEDDSMRLRQSRRQNIEDDVSDGNADEYQQQIIQPRQVNEKTQILIDEVD